MWWWRHHSGSHHVVTVQYSGRGVLLWSSTCRYLASFLNKFVSSKIMHPLPNAYIKDSYTPRTLRTCCRQSEFRILKIRESSARAFYFCTIALRTPYAVLTQASASCRVDSFSTRVIIYCWLYFNDFLNLLKCLFITLKKEKKFCLCHVWIRLTTVYLLCAWELWQNNAQFALQF